MNPRMAWPAVVLTCAGAAAATVMAVAGVDRETIVIALLGLLSPVVTSMVSSQVADVKATAQVVERQTNGNQAVLLDLVRVQSELLARSSPPALPPAGPAPSTDRPAEPRSGEPPGRVAA